jgi:hypothetical protein
MGKVFVLTALDNDSWQETNNEMRNEGEGTNEGIQEKQNEGMTPYGRKMD